MSKKQLALLVVMLGALGGAACDGDNPTAPNNNTIAFNVSMSSAQEVPPVSNSEAGATGTATITFNVTRTAANAIATATANFTATVSNMPAGSNLILAHIHAGAAGVTGGFVVNTGLTAATAVPIVNGAATLSFNNITVDPTVAQTIIDNPAGFYFNVHSTLNPGGVVRGQLVKQ